MRDKREFHVSSIGIVSLLMIFIVVSMVIFTLMSLSEATRSYNYGSQLAEHSTDYYAASNIAEEQIAAISKALKKGSVSGDAALDSVSDFKVSGEFVSFQVPINDKQLLYVKVSVSSGKAEVVTFAEKHAGEWNGDNKITVMNP